MSTSRAAAAIPLLAAALLLGACGDDSQPAATAPATAVAPTTTVSPTTVTPTTTPLTYLPATDPPTPTTLAPGPRQIDVLIGTDDSPTRIETVPVGSPVTINIINPDGADEYHVHGYDIEVEAGAGTMATINFTADVAGRFEVESHVTHGVLFVLDVV